MAVEADKAKPQVGQLSDLGLVEMTRHRQGQAISEIFAKRCPHCQGNGYIMEDIKFASATSEGEYRAKAAKLKLPMGGKKKFNNNNKFNNKPQEEIKETVVQEEKLEPITENPSVEAQAEVQEIKQEIEVKKSSGRGRRKVKETEVKAENIAQTVINETSEIAPVIAEDAAKKVEESAVEEKTPVAEEKATETTPAETAVEEVKTEETAEEKPKRTRRPNRNSQKRTRKTTKKNVEE